MRGGKVLRGALLAAIVGGSLCLSAPAFGALTPLGHVCSQQSGVRFCPGSAATRTASFDGVPLDADVTLPAGGDGPFPTIVMMHGWGGSKSDFEAASPSGNNNTTYHYNNVYFAQQGYAVLTYSARGWGDSCGSPSSRSAPGCASGWIHLADQRYEAHDTQYLLGLLVDQGVTKPGAIGVTGISYGGGQSIELAFLKNRVRLLPSQGSGFAPWTSPAGVPLSITAAYPRWPWSDLVDSLEPNGRFLDFTVPAVGDSRAPIGVAKQSYVEGLYGLGLTSGFYSAPGQDPNADLTTWNQRVLAGEPEDASAQAIAAQIGDFHQGFGIPGTPAPLLLQSGWTDDLFPPKESLRIYNHVRSLDPGFPVSLQFGDLGHARGTNVPNADRAFQDQGAAFFDHYLRGVGSAPAPGSVEAWTQACPTGKPSDGPFRAGSWPLLHPGAVLFGSAAAQTVTSDGGDPSTALKYDPIAGGTAGGTTSCSMVAGENAPGTANYLGPKTSGAYTLMGLPTVSAHVTVSGQFGQLDSRLWDVDQQGRQTLISRGVYRLLDNQDGNIAFQLSGNAWRFAPGHRPKLELLGRDPGYLRPSNGSFSVRVSNVVVELPTHEAPGAGGGSGGGRGGSGVSSLVPRSRTGRLRLVVRPHRVRAGHVVRVRFLVRTFAAGLPLPVAGAKIRFAGHRLKTNRRGRASLRIRLRHGQRVVVTRSGLLSASDRVVVRRR
jgi:predicted acyl esterase